MDAEIEITRKEFVENYVSALGYHDDFFSEYIIDFVAQNHDDFVSFVADNLTPMEAMQCID